MRHDSSKLTQSTRPERAPDAELVQLTLQGADEAFAELANRYSRMVFGTAWADLRQVEDAEDALQETFLLAYRCLGDLRDPGRFGSWLYSIARNTVRKALGRRRLKLAEQEEVTQRESENAEEAIAHLIPAMDVMTPDDRSVVVLFYLVGMSQKRIAQLISVPEGTVKSRLYRARKILKRRLLDMAKERLNSIGPHDDYGRDIIGGMRGEIHWRRLLDGKGLENWSCSEEEMEAWTRSDQAIVGEVPREQGSRLFTGGETWRNYELSVLVTPISGGNAQIQFRITEDRNGYYMMDFLLGWRAIAISRGTSGFPGVEKLSVVNFPAERGREYNVQIAARDSSLTTYVDGKLVNQLTDSSFESGPIALCAWHSKTAFRDPRIRHLH